MARIPFGEVVRHRLTDRRGVVVRGPHDDHRKPKLWRRVLFDGDAEPTLAVTRLLYIEHPRGEGRRPT